MLSKALELAIQVTHPIAAAAFAAVLALICFLALSKGKRKPPHIAWLLAVIIFLLGLAPLLSSTYLDSRGIYRVRIEVFGRSNETLQTAEIVSSAGGELKKTNAGWEFTIPREERPRSGEVTFRAVQKDAFLSGSTTISLGRDYFPQVRILLTPLPSVKAYGVIEDENGRPIVGVKVWVLGSDEVTTTGPTGSFSLSAQAADGQQITLVAQKGNKAVQKAAFAGKLAEIILR
jgi:hypothetical protein